MVWENREQGGGEEFNQILKNRKTKGFVMIKYAQAARSEAWRHADVMWDHG